MSPYLFALLCAVAVLVVMAELLRRRQLREKYAALWLVVGGCIAVAAAVPAVPARLSEALGVAVPANLLFFVAISLLLSVTVHLSWELSRLEDETRTLAEDLAILRLDLETLQARHDTSPGGATSGDQGERRTP